MILVDTSVWIHHLNEGDAELVELLDAGLVSTHSFVIGEIACGHTPNRRQLLQDLQRLPRVRTLSLEEWLHFTERRGLIGCGLGFVDIHLLGSSALSEGMHLWTRDARLQRAAEDLGLH
jgi:predicted nucleic acid-binding protein